MLDILITERECFAVKAVKKVLKTILIIILAVVVLGALFIGYLTLTEYKPADVEEARVVGDGLTEAPAAGQMVKILTWNVGYAGLGKDADFIMDGGGNAPVASKELVHENIDGIKSVIARENPDIVMLQEVEERSQRTYNTEQVTDFSMANYSFAYNYKCNYVPFPWPPIGKIASGVYTTTNYDIASAERYSLPCPFSWPLRVANLKRCMLSSRIPMADGNELIIVNFHLEAYDSGEGKIAQTKMLMEYIQSEYEKGNYVIAGGDFNQTFPGSLEVYPNTHVDLWNVGLIEADVLPNGWNFAYDTSSPTCRLLNQPYDPSDTVNTQFYVIDGFICSPNVEIASVQTLNEGFTYSDHNPVELIVGLK